MGQFLTSWTLQNIENFITNLGFPIFVALYFLFTQRKFESETNKVLEEIRCIQSQLLETKLQVGQAISSPGTEVKK